MNYETTASPAGDDDTRLYQVTSPFVGAEARSDDDDADQPVFDDQEEGDEPTSDTIVEVEYDGRRYAVPRELKDALLRQADYTRKTMELADQRRTLAADRAELEQVQAMAIEELRTAMRLHEIEEHLHGLAQHDWSGVDPHHPEVAQLRGSLGEMLAEQAQLHALLGQHEQHKTARAQQETARTRAETDAAMAREIQDWSPDRRQLLESLALDHGVPEDCLGDCSPGEMRLLHLAHIGTQHLERQRAANRGAYRPAAEVGGSAGAGPSDPSRMTMAQYRAWRAKQK